MAAVVPYSLVMKTVDDNQQLKELLRKAKKIALVDYNERPTTELVSVMFLSPLSKLLDALYANEAVVERITVGDRHSGHLSVPTDCDLLLTAGIGPLLTKRSMTVSKSTVKIAAIDTDNYAEYYLRKTKAQSAPLISAEPSELRFDCHVFGTNLIGTLLEFTKDRFLSVEQIAEFAEYAKIKATEITEVKKADIGSAEDCEKRDDEEMVAATVVRNGIEFGPEQIRVIDSMDLVGNNNIVLVTDNLEELSTHWLDAELLLHDAVAMYLGCVGRVDEVEDEDATVRVVWKDNSCTWIPAKACCLVWKEDLELSNPKYELDPDYCEEDIFADELLLAKEVRRR